MPVIVNPFDAGGFTLAEMTAAIQLLPNPYGRVGQLGLFAPEPISQRNVIIESIEGELRLLPAVAPGAPATVGSTDKREVRSFAVPHIPHNDVVLPEEVQGVRGLGLAAGEDPLVTVMTRKLARMRAKHAQTLEYMRVNALLGVTKDGAGNTIYDWHAEFGLAKKSVDFLFGSSNADMMPRCTEVARHIEENLKGEMMTSIHALVSPEFFDRLVAQKGVKEAYAFYQGTAGTNPLRDDVRRGFRFGPILFEEYFGTVTLANGSTERLIPAGEGVAFTLGTLDTFKTYFAPANLMEAVGTYGQELYAYQIARPNGTGIDIYTQSNPLPIVKRPALTVRLFSSN
ncbi:major capsid protein [Thauera propionica]|uniref:major capsid protein n=1 Tax=Thauera propionica TaxID=2019431 RepID=UPI0023EFCC55|nr:major capsid protein [Thauera propionica]MDD3676893.1 major capsid protein [Thauera propionica]